MKHETLDLDWFGIDASNKIGHFASAGGYLPSAIYNNIEYSNKVAKIIRGLPEISESIVNPHINEIKNKIDAKRLTTYIADFDFFAKRGIYSYDRTYVSNINDNSYHIVAWPKIPLELTSLPIDIVVFIAKLKYNMYFSEAKSINPIHLTPILAI